MAMEFVSEPERIRALACKLVAGQGADLAFVLEVQPSISWTRRFIDA